MRDCCPDTFTGNFRPFETLSSVTDLRVAGNWTLQVQDHAVNELEGELVEWSMEFELKECVDEFRWTEIELLSDYYADDDGFVPDVKQRFDHTAVVVGDSMYVWGGLICCVFEEDSGLFHNQPGQDLWRYDVSTRKWVELQPLIYTPPGYTYNPDYLPPGRVGRAMLITPWRGIAMGGLATVWSDQEYTNSIWQWNPPTDEWYQYQNVEASGLVLASYRNASDRLRLWDYSKGESVFYNEEVCLEPLRPLCAWPLGPVCVSVCAPSLCTV